MFKGRRNSFKEIFQKKERKKVYGMPPGYHITRLTHLRGFPRPPFNPQTTKMGLKVAENHKNIDSNIIYINRI